MRNVTSSTASYPANYNQTASAGSGNQDSRLKAIQSQIDKVQKQLQNLSGNDKMSLEEKMNKQKELQQQLQDLNKQLAQRKAEIQQEKREKAAAKDNSQAPAPKNIDRQEFSAFGIASMESMIRADASMKQVKAVQSAKTSMEGHAGVLEREIKADKERGGSAERKEAELERLNKRIQDVSANMMEQASDINTTPEKSEEENRAKTGESKERADAINREDTLTGAEIGDTVKGTKTLL